jgi:putative ATPase
MRNLRYGEEYKYPHDYEGAVTVQAYRPPELEDKIYYSPSDRGYEQTIRNYLSQVRRTKE